jgi:phosphoglycolate phosphatase
MDGTVSDSLMGLAKSFQFALKSFGIMVNDAEELRQLMGAPVAVSFRDVYGFDEGAVKLAVTSMRSYYESNGIFDAEPFPGIPELLRDLKAAGKTLVIASSKPLIYSKQILEHFGFLDVFSFVSGDELAGGRGEKSQVIKYALDNVYGITPENALMIGDRFYDVEGAHSNGVACIAVLYGYGSEEELRSAGADAFAANSAELRAMLL